MNVLDLLAGRLPKWERQWPGRLSWEMHQLSLYGRVMGVNLERNVLSFRYHWTQGGITRDLWIVYHPDFPYVRPEVRLLAPADTYPRRHCDPYTGSLCYLGHSKHEWRPGDSIAAVINGQLPKIFGTSANEDPIGEPAENWWNQWNAIKQRFDDRTMFLVDSDWTPGEQAGGFIEMRTAFGDGRPPLVRCGIEQVLDNEGRKICGGTITFPAELRDACRIKIPWVCFDDEIFPRNDDGLFDSLIAKAGVTAQPIRVRDNLHVKLVAAVFPTEITHGRTGWSWVLLMHSGSPRAFGTGGKPPKGDITRSIVQTYRAGPTDLRTRAPSASRVHGRTVAIAGVGAIGAPIALEFARNGAGTLSMVDGDLVKPGNGVRWPLSASTWGRRKVDALGEHIGEHYNGVRVHGFCRRLGEIDLSAATGEDGEIGQLLRSADVLIDATAEFAPQRILFALANQIGKHLITVSATPNLEGGSVAAFAPGGACPVCLFRHQLDGTVPTPPGENGDALAVKLPGCAEATFAGASFDLGELSLEAVRVAVRTLGNPSVRSYVETLSFEGEERLPSWRIDRFDPHPECGCR